MKENLIRRLIHMFKREELSVDEWARILNRQEGKTCKPTEADVVNSDYSEHDEVPEDDPDDDYIDIEEDFEVLVGGEDPESDDEEYVDDEGYLTELGNSCINNLYYVCDKEEELIRKIMGSDYISEYQDLYTLRSLMKQRTELKKEIEENIQSVGNNSKEVVTSVLKRCSEVLDMEDEALDKLTELAKAN